MSSRFRPSARLAGKLSAPRLGRVFERARLFNRLDGWSDSPAIWVAAAPGAGKSTLVATWLRARQRPTLWLQLDRDDADPATFLRSLDLLLAGMADRPVALPAFRADDLTDLAGWLRRRMRLLMPVLPSDWALVLDNHQELPADSPLHLALAQVIGELPDRVQWIFISREPPPAVYTAPMARQQLTVLDAEDLRLDAEEALTLTRLHGRPDAMAAALAIAQGWAGGMTLMLLGSPRHANAPGLKARQRLFDYFAGEVLVGMSVDEQEALGAMALVPGVGDDLAVALSGYQQAPALLERLASLSLFIDRRETEPVVYVFHALFREFLSRRFEAEHTSGELARLRLRAGRLLIAAGQVDAGLQILVDAQHWDDALEAILHAAPRYVADGRTQALVGRIDGMPAAMRDRLSYWRGYCLLETDPVSALADLVSAHAGCAAAGDVDGELLAVAALSAALVTCGRLPELDPWLQVLSRHAGRAASSHAPDVELRLVPGLLAAVVYRAPWHPLAEPLAQRAERLLHAQSAPGQRLLLGSLAFHLLWRGHVDRLARIVLQIDALCADPLAAPVTLMRWWGVGILVKTLLGQTAGASEDAARALALIDAEPSVGAQRASVELLCMIIALAQADPRSARLHLNAAAQALHPDHAVDRATLEHQLGMLALLEDDRPTALRVMRASVISAKVSGFPMREHLALIANALAAARSGEHAEAQQLLAAAFGHPFHAVSRWHHWVAGMVAAYAAVCRGDDSQARVQLCDALAVARECGYRYGPMLYCCGDMMARLAALALAHGIEPDVARDLVARNQLKAPAQADASWPWAVRVQALGRLSITRADGSAPTGRKESRRLLELAALLAAHGDTPISLDALADALWPDADADAARNALDNSVHRLRKLLGGDDRVVLRQGALALNPQRCWTDVAELERLLTTLDSGLSASTPLLVAAVHRLYRSPLLPGVALAGVAARRRALHLRVRRTLVGAADSLAVAGLASAAADAVAACESLPDL